MILIIEPDKQVRKKLCDLLSRERIIGKAMITDALEVICRYKRDIALIIAHVQVLVQENHIHALNQVCRKLAFEPPPILGICPAGQPLANPVRDTLAKKYRLVHYSETDPRFPDEYLSAVSKLFPGACLDPEQARREWSSKKTDEMADLQKWLKDEGFVVGTTVEQAPAGAVKATAPPATKPEPPAESVAVEAAEENTELAEDYQALYYDLKQKYEELLNLVNDLLKTMPDEDCK